MNWALAAAAPATVGLVFWASGIIHPAIVAYHVLCGVAVWRRRERVRTLLRTDRTTLAWTAGTTLVVALFLIAAPFFHDPAPYRALFRRTLLPWGDPATLFGMFAAYTMVIHAPLEISGGRWRWIPDQSPPRRRSPNGVFSTVPRRADDPGSGPLGLLAAVPAGAAGRSGAFVTIRHAHQWPGLVMAGADGLILGGVVFFVR
jgi:hypothetical protein